MPHKYPQQEKQQELRPYWGTMMIQSNLLNILFLGKTGRSETHVWNMLHIYQLNLTKFKIPITRPTAGGRW